MREPRTVSMEDRIRMATATPEHNWKGSGHDAGKNMHEPPWASVLASLEAFATSCGWPSLAAMKASVLRSRGLA